MCHGSVSGDKEKCTDLRNASIIKSSGHDNGLPCRVREGDVSASGLRVMRAVPSHQDSRQQEEGRVWREGPFGFGKRVLKVYFRSGKSVLM